jgi:hypothetical protein
MDQEKPKKSEKLLSGIGTEHQFRWLRIIVAFIIVMNILDAAFTLLWVNTGLAKEANVLLRYLVEHYPVLFFVTKFALVLAGTYILWRNRYNKYAVFGLFLAFLVYYALLLYHLEYFSHLVSRHIFGPQPAAMP